MKRSDLISLLFSGAVLLTGQFWAAPGLAQSIDQPFGQERVETREFRNPDMAAAAAERNAQGGHQHGHGHGHGKGDSHDHGVETENLFGFTLGSDTEPQGSRGVALESILRFGKRESNYTALGQKLEFAYGVTNNLSVSLSLLGDYHRISERPLFAGSVETVNGRYIFNGFGGEIRYRFFDRKSSPFGLTLHLEPSVAFSDEASGLRGRKYGSENKLIFDREVVTDKVFVALNLLQELEVTKGKGAAEWERGTTIGASVAASFQIAPNIFLGAEAKYLRSYDRLSLKNYNGDAWYLGPTAYARFAERFWLSLAYNGLVGGHAKASSEPFDLGNFERHQFRLKAGLEF